jgi:ParB-like chromosome segregation protein Spo0J
MDELYASVMLPLAAIETDPEYERLFPPLSAEDRAQLADSIKRVGLIAPLCVTRRDDRWILLDGHHRLRVLQDLGWAAVPCLVARNAAHEVELLYSANLQRRQLTPDHRERLLADFAARLAQVTHCISAPLLDEVYARVSKGEITTEQLVARLADVWPAPPAQPAAAGDSQATGEAENAGLRQRAEDAERRLKLARQEFERLIQERDHLQEIVEMYERRGPAPADAPVDAAVEHARRELRDMSRRFGDLSRRFKELSEERDKLSEELARAKEREDLWLNGERRLLANELELTQEENQRLRGLLKTADKAAACLRALRHAAEELETVLDHQAEPWTKEERRAVAEAYGALAEVWARLREPLELALGGLPAGRSVFDRMFPDKRHREPLELFLAERAGKPAASGRDEAEPKRARTARAKQRQAKPSARKERIEFDDEVLANGEWTEEDLAALDDEIAKETLRAMGYAGEDEDLEDGKELSEEDSEAIGDTVDEGDEHLADDEADEEREDVRRR